ncbi:MAG: D-aminoacyl-tRNA deacylase, partial [Candidatus Methanomethylicia archaeon]
MGKIKAKTIIFASKMDIASRNIKNQILKNHEFKEDELEGQKIYYNVEKQVMLVEILEDSIYAENIEGKFEAELFIFATRHSAESRIPALLTHVPGNWTENTSMGGKPRSVAIAPPTTLKIALMELEKQARENH